MLYTAPSLADVSVFGLPSNFISQKSLSANRKAHRLWVRGLAKGGVPFIESPTLIQESFRLFSKRHCQYNLLYSLIEQMEFI